MSGTASGPGAILVGPGSEEPVEGPELSPEDEGTWTAERALRKFSQLTFSYGLSAVCAGISAVIMSIPTDLGSNAAAAAVLPFAASLVISAYIFTDLLEFLWDGFAGRLLGRYGPSGRLWEATLAFLLVGIITLVTGVVLAILVFGWPADFAYLVPAPIALLTVCGLSLLIAVVLPPAVLGPPMGQRMAAAAAGIGSLGVAAEGVVALTAPFGSNPALGWMEGTFPLLNWNAGFAALVGLSAFLAWASYRYILPKQAGRAAAIA